MCCSPSPYSEAPLTRDHRVMAVECPACGRNGLVVWAEEPREGFAEELAPPASLPCPGCR